MNLYISNLSAETTEQDLEQSFSVFGAIKSLKIIMDKETGLSKGYGFVEMEDKYAAFDAIDNIDMTFLKGNIVNVREAKNNKEVKTPFSKPYKQGGYKKPFQDKTSYPSNDRMNYNNNDSSVSNFDSDKDYNNDLSYNA